MASDGYDAMAESFVDTYKTELISDRVWKTATQVELGTVGWVGWYNSRRLHGELGDVPPIEYERNALAAAADRATEHRASTLLTIESK